MKTPANPENVPLNKIPAGWRLIYEEEYGKYTTPCKVWLKGIETFSTKIDPSPQIKNFTLITPDLPDNGQPWHAHKPGDPAPVEIGVKIDIVCKNGEVIEKPTSPQWGWHEKFGILFYRLHEPKSKHPEPMQAEQTFTIKQIQEVIERFTEPNLGSPANEIQVNFGRHIIRQLERFPQIKQPPIFKKHGLFWLPHIPGNPRPQIQNEPFLYLGKDNDIVSCLRGNSPDQEFWDKEIDGWCYNKCHASTAAPKAEPATSTSDRILSIFIAAGYITEEQVEQARKLVKP